MTNIVIYSMSNCGAGAIYEACRLLPEHRVLQVHSLCLEQVARSRFALGQRSPRALLDSETVLRELIPSGEPIKFISLVRDPLARHMSAAFRQLRRATKPRDLNAALTNQAMLLDHFNALPAADTLEWIQNELNHLLGADLMQHRFLPQDHGYYKIGPHELLILSTHAPDQKKTKLLAEYMGSKLPEPVERVNVNMHPAYPFYQSQIVDGLGADARQFWESAYAKHFFSSGQLNEFKQQAQASAKAIKQRYELLAPQFDIAPSDAILSVAINPQIGFQELAATVQDAAQNISADTLLRLGNKTMAQLERAWQNTFVAQLRALAAADPQAATLFAKTYIDRVPDARALRLAIALMRQAGDIEQPLRLLDRMPDQYDSFVQRERLRLSHMQTLWLRPYEPSQRKRAAQQKQRRVIMYVAHQTIPYHSSGYATRTQGLVSHLVSDGWPIEVYARLGYPADTRLAPATAKKHKQDGVTYHFSASKRWGKDHADISGYINAAAEALVRQGKRQRASLVHGASNYLNGMAAVEAARRLGVPSIYEMRGLWHLTRVAKQPDFISTEQFAMIEQMELATARAADHVLAITGVLRAWLIQKGVSAKKITVVPNAVDGELFKPAPRDAALEEQLGLKDKLVVGYIGSFTDYEGLDLLLAAAAKVRSKAGDLFRLLWVGDGPALPALLQQAKELGLEDCTISLGRQPFAAVQRYYSLVDIAVFPRKGHAVCEIVSPLKPFEAMAMGKGVIVSNVRPLTEIIVHNKTGLVAEKDNDVSLAIQLQRMVTDAALRARTGKAARRWIETTRNWDVIAKTVGQVYAGLGQPLPGTQRTKIKTGHKKS